MKYLFLLLVLVSACKKSEDRACWKFAGVQVSQTIDLQPFDKLYVGTGFDIELVQDTVDRLEIFAAENLMNFLTYEQVEGELELKNSNKCRFLRNSKGNKVKMILHFKELKDLRYEGTGEMTMKGKVVTDRFSVILLEGASKVNFDVDVNDLVVHCVPNYRTINLQGKAKIAKFNLKGNCTVNSQLEVQDKLTVITISSSDSYVVSPEQGLLKVDLRGRGNIYYRGNPGVIDLNDQGEGNLLKQN